VKIGEVFILNYRAVVVLMRVFLNIFYVVVDERFVSFIIRYINVGPKMQISSVTMLINKCQSISPVDFWAVFGAV
jgi:hypothetical protein